jgi:hypothetical protein
MLLIRKWACYNKLMTTLWNERIPTLEEERRYQKLIQLHGLTHSWMKEMGEPASYRLERASKPELSQTLWLLEKIKLDELPPQLSDLVDGATVSQFLDELQETILIVQLTTLENVLENSPEKTSVLNLLERVSWSYSKTLAESTWSDSKILTPEQTFSALKAHPLAEKPAPAFLLESWNAHELSFHWLNSPLGKDSLKRSPFVKELCQIQLESLRGYVYGVNRTLAMTVEEARVGPKPSFRIQLSVSN